MWSRIRHHRHVPYYDEFQRLRREQTSAGLAIADTMAPGMSLGVNASADAADDNDDIIYAMLEETKG